MNLEGNSIGTTTCRRGGLLDMKILQGICEEQEIDIFLMNCRNMHVCIGRKLLPSLKLTLVGKGQRMCVDVVGTTGRIVWRHKVSKVEFGCFGALM